jgi:DNA-binding CsgD family transcriptional regulator
MSDSRIEQLTPTQKEALRLVAEGRTSKEIARLTGVSESAIDQRLDRARSILGARNRREAAHFLVRFKACEETTCAPLPVENQPDAGPAYPSAAEPALPNRLSDSAVEWRSLEPPRETVSLLAFARDFLEGIRPDELTMPTRWLLVLAIAMALGFLFLALSAGGGILLSIADALKLIPV